MLFEAIRRIQGANSKPPAPSLLWELDDSRHEKWQKLCKSGKIVEAIKQARAMDAGLDLSEAYELINAYREKEGILPPKTRWWWPF